MKNLFVVILALFSFESFGKNPLELPLKAKKIIFEEIIADVFFEDEGFTREPTDINDFTYTIEDESMIRVTGKSFSSWDMKEIKYDCSVEVLTRGKINRAEDIIVNCKLEGENWPRD